VQAVHLVDTSRRRWRGRRRRTLTTVRRV
jgi:hypothetical protein